MGGPTRAFISPPHRVLLGLGVELPTSLWAALPRHSPPCIVMGLRASVLDCPQRSGQPYCGGRLLSSSCSVEPQRWAAHVAVGCPTSVFASLRHCGVACFDIGQPTSLWTALPRRSPPLAIEGLRASVLGCPQQHGHPYRSGRLLSSLCGVKPQCWAAHVVVGCPTAAFASPCGRMVSDCCVVSGLGVRLPSSSGCIPRRCPALPRR